jgi:hypothetical protein
MDCAVFETRVDGDVAEVLAHCTNRGSWQGSTFVADESEVTLGIFPGTAWFRGKSSFWAENRSH